MKIPQKSETKKITTIQAGTTPEDAFAEVVHLIESARQRAFQSVNTALIDLYWQIGEYISHRIAEDGWVKGTVAALAAYIEKRHPGLRGFSPQNLWRMRQFFEAYRDTPKLSSLLRELPWSSNLHILTKTKRPEEREFYLEALDPDIRKPHERPSIGVLLRATRDREVVEYALSSSLTPALVSEYQTRLPDKKLPQAKLHESYELAQSSTPRVAGPALAPPATANPKPMQRRR